MDPQHRGQWIGKPATFLDHIGVVGLNQIDQCMLRNNSLHLSEYFSRFVYFLAVASS